MAISDWSVRFWAIVPRRRKSGAELAHRVALQIGFYRGSMGVSLIQELIVLF
jgi:hypothetical protein